MNDALQDLEDQWVTRAACMARDDRDVPIPICDLCPVWAHCLEHALTLDIPDGTWGGYDRAAREELLEATDFFIGEALLRADRLRRERQARLHRRMTHPSYRRIAHA